MQSAAGSMSAYDDNKVQKVELLQQFPTRIKVLDYGKLGLEDGNYAKRDGPTNLILVAT